MATNIDVSGMASAAAEKIRGVEVSDETVKSLPLTQIVGGGYALVIIAFIVAIIIGLVILVGTYMIIRNIRGYTTILPTRKESHTTILPTRKENYTTILPTRKEDYTTILPTTD